MRVTGTTIATIRKDALSFVLGAMSVAEGVDIDVAEVNVDMRGVGGECGSSSEQTCLGIKWAL